MPVSLCDATAAAVAVADVGAPVFDLMDLETVRPSNTADSARAVVDCGTTFTASGRAKLFPKKLIETYNPPFKVRTASLHVMPVAFIGTMIVKPKGAPKKRVLACHHALHIPQMGNLTLLSCKALWHVERRLWRCVLRHGRYRRCLQRRWWGEASNASGRC